MPGPLPLPEGEKARANAPTIPTTSLPVGGRTGRVPPIPSWITLGKPGLAWWKWAWKTPHACAWSSGDHPMIARRAQLEDDLASIELVNGLDLAELVDCARQDEVDRAIRRIAALATGRLQICKQMLELEDRLGLTPKGMAAMRWKIVAPPQAPKVAAGTVTQLDAERRKRVQDAS